jgi:hypothetical protein
MAVLSMMVALHPSVAGTNDYPVPVLVAAMLALSLGGGVAVGRLISAIRQVVSRR